MRVALIAQAPTWLLEERRDGFRERYLGLLSHLADECTELNVLVVDPAHPGTESVTEEVTRAGEQLHAEHARLLQERDITGSYAHIVADPREARVLRGAGRGIQAIRSMISGVAVEAWERQAGQMLVDWGPDTAVSIGYPRWHRLRFVSDAVPSVLLLEEDQRRDPEHGPNSFKARFMNWVEGLADRRWFTPPTHAAVIGQQEISWAQRVFPRSVVALVPHAIDLDYWFIDRPGATDSKNFVAVGHMGHLRNAQGLIHIGNACSTIGLSGEDARIQVVSATKLHPEAGTVPDCIRLNGDATDVRPYYREARAALIPSFTVMGAKTTILQAWASRCPVVTTTAAARSVGGTNGVDLLAGDTPLEVARHMHSLLNDDHMCSELAAAGLDRVRAEHSWGAMGATVTELLGEAADSRPLRPSVIADSVALVKAWKLDRVDKEASSPQQPAVAAGGTS